MKNPFEEPIHDLLIRGRITEATAEILTRHYAKQPDHFKEEMAAAPEDVNLAHLMRLIDLLEKKNEMRKEADPPQKPVSPAENSPEIPRPVSCAEEVEASGPTDTPRVESEQAELETRLAEVKRKCDALEVELAAEKEFRREFEKRAFDYAKKYADAEEERRLARTAEESSRKTLEEEHRQLLEEVRRTREGEKIGLEKTQEGRSSDLVALGQEKERLAKELEGSHEEKGKALARIKELEESSGRMEMLKNRCADLEEELKKEKEVRAKIQAQFQGLEKTLLDLERQINALS